MYICIWQIHSALFRNFSGTELSESESDSNLIEPKLQLDANPVLLDPLMFLLPRDSSLSDPDCFTEGRDFNYMLIPNVSKSRVN